jgi:hypothetical protein
VKALGKCKSERAVVLQNLGFITANGNVALKRKRTFGHEV